MAHAQHPQLTPLEQLNIDIEEATTNYNAMATRGQQIIEIIQGIREREPEGVTDHALELELTLNAQLPQMTARLTAMQQRRRTIMGELPFLFTF